MVRKNTNMLLDMVAEGTLDKDQLIRDLLMWMSESEVEDFAAHSGVLSDILEVEEEEIRSDYEANRTYERVMADVDGDHASALASAGWGTDEDYGYSGDVDDGY
jgi:hypothetical protein